MFGLLLQLALWLGLTGLVDAWVAKLAYEGSGGDFWAMFWWFCLVNLLSAIVGALVKSWFSNG